MDGLVPPQQRDSIVGREQVEAQLRAAIDADALTNGWLIAGPKGAGKASLAYRIARALLDPAALARGDDLSMPAGARTFRLVAAGAHPDLFVAERRFDEKTQRYESEISVETIRKLTAFLSRTASMGGWRVAIVDTADDMNRNAANALLKALEEPPEKATLLLLAAQPGRLLATVRSRCRRLDLRAAPDATVAALAEREAGLAPGEAAAIARAAQGRPGYALALAAGEGGEAVAATAAFLDGAARGGDVSAVIGRLSGKTADERWEIFLPLMLESVGDAARRRARGEPAGAPFERADPGALAEAHGALSALAARGDGLNLDRGQLIASLARTLGRALQTSAA